MLNHRKANRFALHNPSPRESGIPSTRVPGEGREGGPVIVYARPITDTCKEVVDGMVRRTVPRDGLVDAQGPWVFDRAALEALIDAVTDESKIGNIAELCFRAQLPIRVRLG